MSFYVKVLGFGQMSEFLSTGVKSCCELITKLILKPIVIFRKIDNYINAFSKKLFNISKDFIPCGM